MGPSQSDLTRTCSRASARPSGPIECLGSALMSRFPRSRGPCDYHPKGYASGRSSSKAVSKLLNRGTVTKRVILTLRYEWLKRIPVIRSLDHLGHARAPFAHRHGGSCPRMALGAAQLESRSASQPRPSRSSPLWSHPVLFLASCRSVSGSWPAPRAPRRWRPCPLPWHGGSEGPRT